MRLESKLIPPKERSKLTCRALNSIQSSIGLAPQAQETAEDVDMGATSAIGSAVEAILNDTNARYVLT
jgi:hypothetical protein